jgi:hypothetical protein
VSKKTRQEKELSRLRRQIEVLRAQESGRSHQYSPPPPEVKEAQPETAEEAPANKLEIRKVEPRFIKKDLLKTAVLALISLATIGLLYLLRDQIPFL